MKNLNQIQKLVTQTQSQTTILKKVVYYINFDCIKDKIILTAEGSILNSITVFITTKTK